MQTMNDKYISLLRRTEQKNPWFWIPSLYVAKGLPYMVLMMLSLIMFKRLGMGNAEITFYTSCCHGCSNRCGDRQSTSR